VGTVREGPLFISSTGLGLEVDSRLGLVFVYLFSNYFLILNKENNYYFMDHQ